MSTSSSIFSVQYAFSTYKTRQDREDIDMLAQRKCVIEQEGLEKAFAALRRRDIAMEEADTLTFTKVRVALYVQEAVRHHGNTLFPPPYARLILHRQQDAIARYDQVARARAVQQGVWELATLRLFDPVAVAKSDRLYPALKAMPPLGADKDNVGQTTRSGRSRASAPLE